VFYTKELIDFYVYSAFNHRDYARIAYCLGVAGVSLAGVKMNRFGSQYSVTVPKSAGEAINDPESVVVETTVKEEEKMQEVATGAENTLREELENLSIEEIKSKAFKEGVDLDGRIKKKDALIDDYIERSQKG
jgi:membrane-associated HD superfamily phosphohydrolase